ncbi:MAG: hydrogenase maturation nickel metallochaperone HypA [Chloroflexi bacterium]|nr:hydrogenase maturation nickel metallochaperone HypA [Chloroflexota bacterium]
MHELAVTQSILEIALRHAEPKKAKRITDLFIVLGVWSSTVDDSIQFFWDMISDGTIAKGATLHFKRTAVEILCMDCGNIYTPNSHELLCPACASTRIKVKTGEEFYLESIEVEL